MDQFKLRNDYTGQSINQHLYSAPSRYLLRGAVRS